MPKTITLTQLKNLNACSDQLALFKKTFGDSVRITQAKALKVAALFDWDWVSSNLLNTENSAEYQRVRASAWAEYQRVRAQTFARLYVKQS